MREPPKLEPALTALVGAAASAATAASRGPAEHGGAEPGRLVHVMIKYTGDTADLEAVGFQAWSVRTHPTDAYSIAAGPIPLDRLGELESIPHIQFVEASRPFEPELNHSVPEINADQLHSASTPHLGTGVVVGIIDSGIDIHHGSFRNADGTTRIQGIWDQTLTPKSWERAPHQFAGAGVEYNRQDIQDTLDGLKDQDGDPFMRSIDDDGHGTHCAGIAAGNGLQAGNCRGSGVFVGVAPKADLLIVKVRYDKPGIGDSPSLVNALDWIWDHPQAAGKAVVINISQGNNYGPHDGTSLVESAIDIDLLTAHGRAVVKSAGNEGDTKKHAAGTVLPHDKLDITFEVRGGDAANRHLEIWYGKANTLKVTVLGVVPPGGQRPASPTVSPNDAMQMWPVVPGVQGGLGPTFVKIVSRTLDGRNSDSCIELDFLRPAGGVLPAGEWLLRLENPDDQPAPFDCWFERAADGPTFTSHETRDNTITAPGTSKGVITVGGYSVRGLLFLTWNGDLGSWSSYGPTRDGRPKPDISAPGTNITSAKSQIGTSCCCDCCVSFWTDVTPKEGPFTGTSMAAPHVAGVIALMFENDPTLPASTVKQRLMATGRQPNGEVLPNNHWGGGRVDALAAVNATPPPANPIVPNPTPIAADPAAGPTSLDDRRAGGPEASEPRRGTFDTDHLARLALASPEGQHWAALVSRHFSEVRGLVNTNKKVATRWHRMEGPRLLWALGEVVTGGDVVTLAEDAGTSTWRLRVGQFLDVLERFGSAPLRRDVRANRAAILALGVPDLLAVLARADDAA